MFCSARVFVRSLVKLAALTAPILAIDVGSASAQSIIAWSNYTVPQNTSGNSAVFTVSNNLSTLTFYFECYVGGAVSACVAPDPVTLAQGEQASISVSYTTGAWGTGSVLLAMTNATGEWWDSRSSEITVTSPPQPAILSTAPHNDQYLNPAGCAAGCFHATAAYSTPAYVARDQARGVTLFYSSAMADPVGVVQIDATNDASTAASKISIELWYNGVQIAGPVYYVFGAGRSRLAAQFDARNFNTGLYKVTAVVKAHYPDSGRTSSTQVYVPILDPPEYFGVGWGVAGLQQLVFMPDSSMVIDQGDGSLARFTSACMPQCAYTSPLDFSRVNVLPAGSVRYIRAYPDSSKIGFDAAGKMVYLVTRSADSTVYAYGTSATGETVLATITDPMGKLTGFNYETVTGSWKLGTIRGIATPGNRWSGFGVDLAGDLRHLQDPDGVLALQMTYDASHRLISRLDRRGSTWTYAYDFAGRISADSLPVITVYGGATTRPTVRFSAPISKVLVNTGLGVGTSSNPAPRVDSAQFVGTITDPGGHAITVATDRYGTALRISEPFGLVTTIDRSGLRPARITYPTGLADVFEYSGAYLTAFYNSSDATYLRYGAKGQVDSVWGSSNVPARYFLSSLNGRVDSVRYAGIDSIKTRYSYASAASVRPESIQDPKGHVTRLRYDVTTGNVDSVLSPGNRFTRRRFDAFGRDTASWNNEGIHTHQQYDVLNRVTKSFAGTTLTDTTRYEYDGPFLKRVRDPKGNIYRFERNAAGWLTRQYDPADTLNRYVSASYDVDGLIRKATNRRGDTIVVTYDSLHRTLTRAGASIEAANYGYNPLGTVTAAWNTISRDSTFSRVTGWTDSVVTWIGGSRFRRQYLPNSNMLLDSVSLTSTTGLQLLGRKYLYVSGTRNLEGIRVGGYETRYSYDADGQSYNRTWPNGITRSVVTTTNHQVGSSSFSTGVSSFDNELWRGYEYDDRSRITQLISKTTSGSNYVTMYSYDALGRLRDRHDNTGMSCVQKSDGSTSCTGGLPNLLEYFSYDSVGNRRDRNGQYSAGNRLTTFAPSGFDHTYTSDLDGNRTRSYRTSNPLESDRRYDWSGDGMLRQVWIRHAGTADDSLQYAYNALGQLVRRSRRGVIDRYYVWNGDNLWLELNGSLARIAEYEYEGLDQPSTLITTQASGGLLLRYLERDEQGRVVAVTNGATIAQRVSYDSWGWPEAIQGLADTSRLLWKGLMWQGDSAQLYFMRNRWYDPATGRFISEDPIGLAGGINNYVFDGDDPVNGWDPYGLCFPSNPGCVWAPITIFAYEPFSDAGMSAGGAGGGGAGGPPVPRGSVAMDESSSQDYPRTCPKDARCDAVETAIAQLQNSSGAACRLTGNIAAERYRSRAVDVTNQRRYEIGTRRQEAGFTEWTVLRGYVITLRPLAFEGLLVSTISHEAGHIRFGTTPNHNDGTDFLYKLGKICAKL